MIFPVPIHGFAVLLLSLLGPAAEKHVAAPQTPADQPQVVRIHTTVTPTREDGTAGQPVPVVIEVDAQRAEVMKEQLILGFQTNPAGTGVITRYQAERMLETLQGLEKQIANLEGKVGAVASDHVMQRNGWLPPVDHVVSPGGLAQYGRPPTETESWMSWVWDFSGRVVWRDAFGNGSFPGAYSGSLEPVSPEQRRMEVIEHLLVRDVLRSLEALLEFHGSPDRFLEIRHSLPFEDVNQN